MLFAVSCNNVLCQQKRNNINNDNNNSNNNNNNKSTYYNKLLTESIVYTKVLKTIIKLILGFFPKINKKVTNLMKT